MWESLGKRLVEHWCFTVLECKDNNISSEDIEKGDAGPGTIRARGKWVQRKEKMREMNQSSLTGPASSYRICLVYNYSQ